MEAAPGCNRLGMGSGPDSVSERTERVALFGKKKKGDEGEAEGSADAEVEQLDVGTLQVQPDKARQFFDRAKAIEQTGQNEYALTLWIGGLRLDPNHEPAMEKVVGLASLVSQKNKGKPTKDSLAATQGGKAEHKVINKWLDALVRWGAKLNDPIAAVRACELAGKLSLGEQTYWIGEKALRIALNDKKPSKELLVKLMDAFSKVGAFDLAVQAGDAAVRLDPADGPLSAEVRNMSAQATMSRGGFDQTGEKGGFRANVKDADKQRQLEEGERLVKTDEVKDRLVNEAEKQFQERPDDMPSMQQLVRRLLERGRPEDEERAKKLLMRAYEQTKQFGFRLEAGKIHLRIAARTLEQYRLNAEAKPDDAAAVGKYKEARTKFLQMEVSELKATVAEYPTDLRYKYELGRRYYSLELYNEAIPLLQDAASDSKVRARALGMLARSFKEIDFVDEAVQTFRDAVEAHPIPDDETGMDLRYGLMESLRAKAEEEQELEAAKEAEKIASSIAIKQIDFRDIRDQRVSLKELVRTLRDSG